MENIYRTLSILTIFLILVSPILVAQNIDCDATSLDDFYTQYGGRDQFNTHSVEAITTFINAENAIQAGDYAQAKTLVETLFNTYPKGSNIWWKLIRF